MNKKEILSYEQVVCSLNGVFKPIGEYPDDIRLVVIDGIIFLHDVTVYDDFLLADNSWQSVNFELMNEKVSLVLSNE